MRNMPGTAAEIDSLTQVELFNHQILPGLFLDKGDFYIAFGDQDIGQGDIPTRWINGDDYLHATVEGLNTPEGQVFAITALDQEDVQLFSYRPKEPLLKAPCQVVKTLDGNNLVVVVYSYGPK